MGKIDGDEGVCIVSQERGNRKGLSPASACCYLQTDPDKHSWTLTENRETEE